MACDGRSHGGSQHHLGRAVDFRLSVYPDTSYPPSEDTLRVYRDDYDSLHYILSSLGVLNAVGLGIYPAQLHPFFHLDTRGSRARWARLEPSGVRYVGIDEGLAWIDDRAGDDLFR